MAAAASALTSRAMKAKESESMRPIAPPERLNRRRAAGSWRATAGLRGAILEHRTTARSNALQASGSFGQTKQTLALQDASPGPEQA